MSDTKEQPGPESAPCRLVDGGDPERESGKLFEELLLPALDDLYRLACRLERDGDRAQDLLQDASLAGFRKFRQLASHGAFRAWMSRIVWRTFLNRRKKRHEEALGDEEPCGGAMGHEMFHGPEEILLARRLSRELASALDRLPEEQRVAVFLIDVQEFSFAEAAGILSIPPGTVASRVARGRTSLRAALSHLARERGWIE